MRQDKLTTKFQEALGDAQSLALAHDNQFLEPVHLLAAILHDKDGSAVSLLERAGVNVSGLTRAADQAIENLPKVSGTSGDIQVSRDLANALNLTEKEAMKRGDEFIATEMFLLALSDEKSDAGRIARENGLTRRALDAAIGAAVAGGRIGDISHAIAEVAHADGYSINTDFGGHGVGRVMHGDPHVPNDGKPNRGYPLRPGLVVALEPWFLQTTDELVTDPDGWTLRSVDGSRGAHAEHTVAITADGPIVLTDRSFLGVD